MILWTLLAYLPPILSSKHIGYPWGPPLPSHDKKSQQSTENGENSPLWSENLITNYQIQQNNILLKLSSMNLEILSDYLPHELSTGQSLQYTLLSPSLGPQSENTSREYSCAMTKIDENKPKLLKNITEKVSLSRFQDLCFDFNIDWWSYQWCSEKEVKQYHVESRKRGKYVKNPEWSLGKYDFTDYERDEHDRVTKAIQYFSGGQICHENNHHRSSEVHLMCCDRYRHERRSPMDIPIEQMTTFNEKYEPELCRYTLEICSPLLCPAVLYPMDPPTTTPSTSLVDFMRIFQKPCLSRQESWWSYEVCFRPSDGTLERQVITDNPDDPHPPPPPQFSGARQFRATTVLTQEGKKISYSQVLEAEFFLGSPPVHLYNNETALRELVVTPRPTVVHRVGSSLSHHSSNTPTAALHLEFSDGKACDIEDTLRGATMEITCGVRDGIEDIIEDRTCHYLFKISSKALCLVDGFAPPKKNVHLLIDPSHNSRQISQISCLPLHPPSPPQVDQPLPPPEPIVEDIPFPFIDPKDLKDDNQDYSEE